MGACAVTLASAVDYVGAGTVEMLLQRDGEFFFMEMNTRLQVEHPVTEALLGVDLVEWQLRVAAGEVLPLTQDDALTRYESGGHAIEVRLCAEDACHGDLPQAGTLHAWRAPDGVRCDDALADGQSVAPYYDSLLAKLVVHANTRDTARLRLARALDETLALGVTTNRALLAAVLRHQAFADADVSTAFLEHQFADRKAALPSAGAEHLALAALSLATHGAAQLPGAWARSALCAPREATVPLLVDGEVQSWFLRRAADSWLATGPMASVNVEQPSWNVDGATLTLAARVARGSSARAWRIDGVLHTTPAGTSLYARCDGVDITVGDLRLAPPQRAGGSAGGDVMPPMHGRLVSLHVAVGDRVTAGQTLAVLEAMKMEHLLTAPIAGRVRALGAKQGAQVSPALVLVEIEPA
jgi:geranyl-CoA carboxylase alpha subunit